MKNNPYNLNQQEYKNNNFDNILDYTVNSNQLNNLNSHNNNATKILETDFEDADPYLCVLNSAESSKGLIIEIITDYVPSINNFKKSINISIPSLNIHLIEKV